MDLYTILLLSVAGLIAGFIDSIAGGGGLITVPTFTLLLGMGATAIGTNKVVAVCSTLVAFLVYLRGGHVSFRNNLIFVAIVGLGSAGGALISPLIPPHFYRWILIAICPIILWIVIRKDLWVRHSIETEAQHTTRKPLKIWIIGLFCGLYDGIAGPGGGTLMFLALYLVGRLPIMGAIATAKFANLSSACLALASFASTGHVRWASGLSMAASISVGAFIGASFTPQRAAPLARAALVVVASLLLLRLIFS